MMIYLTGDQHYSHFNVIRYTNRPWTTAYEMDEALISAWNKVVKINDIVYHLGDFTLGGEAESLFKRLNGYIRVLEYPWHHDKRWLRKQTYTTASKRPIAYEPPIVVLEADVPIILCHYQFLNFDRQHYGSIHFHGHSHGASERRVNVLDVGVD
ncbi:MAG: hypothetical protein MUO26_04685, partial [Methanotrichaceae archaeon]|nr:hypothetical protein [Methanotrichaceae archaeon]